MADHTKLGMNVIDKYGDHFEPWAHNSTDTMMPKVVEALGGQEVVDNLPLLDLGDRTGSTGYLDFVSPKMMSAPIMKGVDSAGRPFIALRLHVTHADGEQELVVEVLQRRYDTGSTWTSGGGDLICTAAMNDKDIAYLSRLVKGEDVGCRGSRYLGYVSAAELQNQIVLAKDRGGRNIVVHNHQTEDGRILFTDLFFETGDVKIA